MELTLELDGERRTCEVDPRMVLVEALRDAFGARGPKIGCLTGDCGACTVRMDGAIVKSCLKLAVAAGGAEIRTLEGLAGPGGLSPLQEAFWDEHAFQCGYCLSGMLFAAEDLLERIPDPTDAEIREAIGGNLCRCTGYDTIVSAVRRAARASSSSGGPPGSPSTP